MLGLESLGLIGLFIATFLAATFIPFSSDAVYIAVLAATKDPIACLIVGTTGNWLGSVFTYGIGWLGKTVWLEKWFKVKHETIIKQKEIITKHERWIAFTCWLPIAGDVIAVALGFYKVHPKWVILQLLLGKLGRFLLWNWIYGLF